VPEITPFNPTGKVASLRYGVGDGAGTSTSEIVPHQSSELVAPDGLRSRQRQSVESATIRTPDSQAPLISPRSSPGSPLRDHLIASHLHHLVTASFGGIDRLPEGLEPRLLANAAVLRAKGHDTPEKVQALLKAAWRHDSALAVVGMGLTGNLGYAVGMEAASELLVAKLPDHHLRNPSLIGMVIGLGVGGLDVAISVMGKAAMKPLLYNGTDGNDHLPPSVKVPGGAEAIMESMKLATSANFLKNMPRVSAPAIQGLLEFQFGGVQNSSIDRVLADRVDTALDAGLGFAASSYVQFRNLTGATGYNARMLLRDDLGAVLDKMERSYKDSAIDMAKGVGSALTQPAVPLAVVATIGLFISELIAANSMIDQAGHSPDGSHGHLPPDRADWGVITAKRASSVALMALMTATIEIGAPIVGAAAQAASEATKSAAGKAKDKITGAMSSAASFIGGAAGHAPNIGAWVAQRLGLQAQAGAEAAAGTSGTAGTEGDVQMTEQNRSQRHAARTEDLPV
jgi:hypothetical protein